MTEEETAAGETQLHGGDFGLLVARLYFQALMNLGMIDHPVSGEREVDLPTARMVIDDLGMLEEKTAGNLDETEAKTLSETLNALRMGFAKTVESVGKPADESAALDKGAAQTDQDS